MLIKTDSLGIPRFTNKDLVDMIYSGHVDKCHVVLCDPSDDIDKFNEAMREQYLPELDFHNLCITNIANTPHCFHNKGQSW